MFKNISNETKVGILATIAIVLVILGINFLKGKNIFSRNITLYSYYNTVEGLTASNPVMLYGMQVGQVDELELLEEGPKNIKVTYHISGDIKFKVPNNTVARIISSDLLGSKALQLVPGDSKALVKNYDTLPGKVEMSLTESISQVVAPVKGKVENLITSVDTIVTALNQVFNEDTKTNLRTSFESIRQTLENIESTSGNVDNFVADESNRLRQIMGSLQHMANTLSENEDEIDNAINNFSAMSDSLRAANLHKVITSANTTLRSVNEMLNTIQHGTGSAAQFINDPKLYDNLAKTSADLDKLVIDLKQNPDRYINFSLIRIGGGGKKDKK